MQKDPYHIKPMWEMKIWILKKPTSLPLQKEYRIGSGSTNKRFFTLEMLKVKNVMLYN